MPSLRFALALGIGLSAALGCTTLAATPSRAPAPAPLHPAVASLAPPPLDPTAVRVEPGPRTVEDHWLLGVYDRLRPGDYRAFRVDFPTVDGETGRAHWLLPRGGGPHAAVLVFPILGGSHVVSEAAAKALTNRGYATLRVERRRLFRDDDPAGDFSVPAARLRRAVLDARRLLDWLETRPEIDPERIAAAGVSVGGVVAATLMGLDERVRAGFFVMAGGGLAEILYESTERPLRRFRQRTLESAGIGDREEFLLRARRHTEMLDPLTWAHRVDPRTVLLVSGRFDRVIPPERTKALWEALGRPSWVRFPAGHYEIAPFFWWAMGRGADHLDDVLGDAASISSPTSSNLRRMRSPASRPGESVRS